MTEYAKGQDIEFRVHRNDTWQPGTFVRFEPEAPEVAWVQSAAGGVPGVVGVENLRVPQPAAAAEYTRRVLRQVTEVALRRLAETTHDAEIRARARAALAQLNHEPAPPRDILQRFPVQPGLDVVVEDSTNILLELRTFTGTELIGRTEPVNRNALSVALVQAEHFAEVTREDAEALRLAHLAARQRERRG